MVYREVVLRFQPTTSERRRTQLLKSYSLEQRRVNQFVSDQVVVVDKAGKRVGPELLDVANSCAETEEVLFATPNFVSEYRRHALPRIPSAQWHLHNLAKIRGQKRGEDVDARDAWAVTTGKPAIVVAVLDDGVDIDHPNLQARIWRNPNKRSKDKVGRDFFLPNGHADHYNPRPKVFTVPYNEMAGNDIHGTPCAGVVAAAGKGAIGVAPSCKILPVKIFHADELAADERVADAIRYAALTADVISCSWSGGISPDLELALEDAKRIGRKGSGTAVFCASGNEEQPRVGYPAADANAIAVGASTDAAKHAWYSNWGKELDVVAPSNGGAQGIYTTDVSYRGRGFNVGEATAGGRDGLHTNDFGGTSSATPLAAGVAALVLSKNPKLTSDEVRDILCKSTDRIGSGYNAKGFSRKFGYGRVNAAKAVAAAASPS